MFSAVHQPAVSNSLLNEVATSGVFPDPALFVYAVLGTLVVASLVVAYAILGRSARHRLSTGLRPSAVPASCARTI